MDAPNSSDFAQICENGPFLALRRLDFPNQFCVNFFTLCGCSVAHMGPPYVANPGKCKVLSSTRSYAGVGAGFVCFQGLHCHIQLGKNPNGVYLAHFPGLAVILVSQGTSGTPALVKKFETGLGNPFPQGLGAMRPQHA